MIQSGNDVVIVGAGIMGCALASELARRELRVAVLDRGQICSGSSGLNAGGVRHQFSSDINIRLATRSIERISSFGAEFGVDVGFKQVGYLFMASSDVTETALRRSVEIQNSFGVATEFISPEDIGELVPGARIDDLRGGSFCGLDGHLDPHSLVMAFAQDARSHGAKIQQNIEAVAVERERGRVTGLVLADGKIVEGKTFVNCAGAWANSFSHLYGAELPIIPWRSQIFSIEGPTFGDRLPMTIDYDKQRTYFHTEGTGVIAGMDNETASEPVWDVPCDWSKVTDLVERLIYRVPAFEEANVAHGWAGFLEVTPDENPIAGWTHFDNLYTAAGFSGHGLSLGPALAEEVARELVGEPTTLSLESYRLDRFDSGLKETEQMAMR
jgi:sarcosine oxidase subunit beta